VVILFPADQKVRRGKCRKPVGAFEQMQFAIMLGLGRELPGTHLFRPGSRMRLETLLLTRCHAHNCQTPLGTFVPQAVNLIELPHEAAINP
jgi:hypothetical protein